MGTVHEDAAQRLASQLLETADGREALAKAHRWMDDPANAVALDVYGQPYSGWTVDQVAALSRLLSYADAGWLRMIYIHVGQTPYRDSAREENRAALASLSFDITAEVYDGLSHHGDGCITIPDDLVIADDAMRDLPDHPEEPAEAWDYVPLEIGHTCASRTFLHLIDSGVVARWPYGLDRIYVLQTTPPHCLQRKLAESISRRHAKLREDCAVQPDDVGPAEVLMDVRAP